MTTAQTISLRTFTDLAPRCSSGRDVGHLHPAHFCYPITDESAGGSLPVLGCRHTCQFCNLGVPPFR